MLLLFIMQVEQFGIRLSPVGHIVHFEKMRIDMYIIDSFRAIGITCFYYYITMYKYV